MIIDCHAHIARSLTGFWQPLSHGKVQDRGEVRQVFPPSFDPVASPPEVLLGYMDQVGVERAFLVQHHMYGDQNACILEAVERWPDRFSGFGYLGGMGQPDAPDQLERLIEAGMTGLKVELQSTRRLRPEFRFDGENEWHVWERLNRLKRPLVLDINGGPLGDLPALQRLLNQFSDVQLLLCHVGGAPGDGWQERALVAKHPRAWVDLAAVAMAYRDEQEYPYPKSLEIARWAIETFGADRVMWGTDYPPALNVGTYRQHLDFVRVHCTFLNDEQRAAITGGNAERFLKSVD